MYRVSDIIGKTVVSAETGNRLGSVSDALVDEGAARVVGLVLGSGVLAKEHVMPFEHVQTLGGDAVLARTDTGMLAPSEWRKSGMKTEPLYRKLRPRQSARIPVRLCKSLSVIVGALPAEPGAGLDMP